MRLTSRQRAIEKFLDKIMTLKAELLVENLEPSLLEKMTAVALPPEVVAVMQDDRLRSYRVSIDTEESSAIDQAMDQKNRTDFLTAMVQFLQTVGPLVNSGAIGFDQAKMMMLFAARAFPGARELEESLEAIQPPQPQSNPADKIIELEGAKLQAQTEEAKSDIQIKVARLELDKEKTKADVALKQQKLEIDAAKIVTG
jgi:multidrug efflux pump subunit AcrA (membrane-fusion protein)